MHTKMKNKIISKKSEKLNETPKSKAVDIIEDIEDNKLQPGQQSSLTFS